MKNIVATLIILHNIKSLFHACQLLPHKDDEHRLCEPQRGNPRRRHSGLPRHSAIAP